MELREVRRHKRRLHLLALFTLCTAFGLLFFGSIGILMASDIMAVNRVGEDKNIDSFCEISDEEVPLITLKGDKRVSFKVNTEYNDPGTVVEDDCDNVTVESSTDLDITKTGDYVITYKSTDNSGNYAEVHRYLRVMPEVGTIYLTFDDGPGPYTAELLDILKKYNVKATFFVTRAGEDSILLRE